MTFALSAAQLDEAARTVAMYEPWKLSSVFLGRSRRATDRAEVEAWTLVGMAFIGSFDATKYRDPYGSPASTTITAENVHDLQTVVPALTVAALRARLADLIWLRARDQAMARLAVDSYLEAAQQIESPTNWVACSQYAERSARLAAQLHDLNHKVFSYLEEVADKYRHQGLCSLAIEAVRVLADLRPDRNLEFVSLLRDVAAALTQVNNFLVVRKALQQIIELARRMNNPEIEREAYRDVGGTFEAEAAMQATAGKHGVAASFYHSAITAYQRAGRSRDAIDRIRPLLEVEERAALPELKRIEVPFDPTDMIAHSIKAVSGKQLLEAIFAFSALLPLCDYNRLHEEVISIAKHAPLGSMLSGAILGPSGRTVARQNGMRLTEDNEDEQAVISRMHTHLLTTRRYIDTQACLLPALYQLNLEYDINLSFLSQLVSSSAFVPPDRQLLFTRGLFAGFEYDFMTATHFLIPQVENTVRQFLRVRNIPTTFFKDGTEREYDLNALLHEPRLEEIMPKGVIFELQCFLIEQRASNFRHQLAHGMFSDDAFSSTDALYIWWLILHLTLAFHPAAIIEPASGKSQEKQEKNERSTADDSQK